MRIMLNEREKVAISKGYGLALFLAKGVALVVVCLLLCVDKIG